MDPSVNVPVLSEHKTFMLPKFSIEARRFTTTRRSAIRFAPWERIHADDGDGSNCGVSPTASAMEKRKDSTGRSR